MRNILLAIVVATLPAAIAAAEQPGRQRPDPPAPERLLPMKRDPAPAIPVPPTVRVL